MSQKLSGTKPSVRFGKTLALRALMGIGWPVLFVIADTTVVWRILIGLLMAALIATIVLPMLISINTITISYWWTAAPLSIAYAVGWICTMCGIMFDDEPRW